jgi:dipeptidyl aminopeptidase/acylaminoacyl peptidase
VRIRAVRLVLAGVLAMTAGGSLAACGTDAPPGLAATPARSSTAAEPSIAPVASGKAPTRTFTVAQRQDTVTRAGRTLRTTTWYPKGGGGPFPAVLFSHGLRGEPADFAPLLSRWAAAGFVVIAPAYPNTHRDAARFDFVDVLNQPADATYVLSQVLAGPLGSMIDPQRLGAAGHSAGAITTVGLFTSARDARLRAGVVLAGAAFGVSTAFAGPAVPLLFVHGDADDVVGYVSGKAIFDAAPAPKALFTLPGEGHSNPYLRDGDAAYKAVAVTTLDFLRYALYGDPAARGRLGADAKPAGTLDAHL